MSDSGRLEIGSRVMVTFTGIIESIRADSDGPSYAVRNDSGYGYSYAKEAAGEM